MLLRIFQEQAGFYFTPHFKLSEDIGNVYSAFLSLIRIKNSSVACELFILCTAIFQADL